MADRDPQEAKVISVTACEHGTVFINLHGEDGEVFARASMSLDAAIGAFNSLHTAVGLAASVLGVELVDDPADETQGAMH